MRFRWSHLHPVHRATVKRVNRMLAQLPLHRKYRVAQRLRVGKMPYSLVAAGDVVLQVGAPADTLHSGRSRGMHLALRSVGGSCIIVEPDPHSAAEFERAAAQLGLDHVTVVNAGAWSEPSSLTLLVDPAHPATNFVEGTVDYAENRLRDFDRINVPVRTIDEIVSSTLGHDVLVRLVSITTNNSEREILRGAKRVLSRAKYLCLARTGEGYDTLASDLGFDYLGMDDRGYTYLRPPSAS